eukprot:Skav227733  [mRNA]  locus=scaffold3513:32520:33482:+ [translate_table: standard]
MSRTQDEHANISQPLSRVKNLCFGTVIWSGTTAIDRSPSSTDRRHRLAATRIGGTRKHDIRQWVMVTSLNPLTIYFFSECDPAASVARFSGKVQWHRFSGTGSVACYVRIAAEDYSLDDFGDRA